MRALLYVVAAVWVVPAVLLVAGLLLLPDYNSSGQCEGIGARLRSWASCWSPRSSS